MVLSSKSGKSDKDHVQDPLDAEKSLQEEEKFGIVHLSEDNTYMEYSASPSSFLSLSSKKLLELCRPESAHWPKVEWSWWIFSKIFLANLLLLVVLLIVESLLFNCNTNKLVISFCYSIFYFPIALTLAALYRHRNVPNEYVHHCKLVRHEYIENGVLVTDILVSVVTTVGPNTDWPFGSDEKNHIRELATIPHWTDLKEWKLYMKNRDRAESSTEDNPPPYSEVTLNPNYLKPI